MRKRSWSYLPLRFVVKFVLVSGVLSIGSVCALSQGSVAAGNHVAVSLVGETTNVVAGRPFQVALRQEIQPGWHTYWSNPGDSGLPTTINWSLPKGFVAAPVLWPTPERFKAGPVVSYGYEGEVLLPVSVDVPSALRPDSPVTLSAHVNWLACSDICIPEEADVSLSVQVGEVLRLDPLWTEAFAATRARLPVANPFPITVTSSNEEITVRVAMGDATRLGDVSFFPEDADVIDDDAAQSIKADSRGLSIVLRRNKSKPLPTGLRGIISYHDLAAQAAGASGAILISAPFQSPPVAPPPVTGNAGVGFAAAVLLAFLGGIILNLMPCVLPVLSIKVLALLEHAEVTPRQMRLQGLAYGAGVLVSFAAIGSALMGLRAGGAAIGWGFQLQSPLFVGLLIYLLFGVGLNLSGVFTIGNRLAGVGSDLSQRAGYSGAFIGGVLATMVATPCTAPFMAAAVGYALTQPWYKSLVVLEVIGLGLAVPYLVITFVPATRRILPKPGQWMLQLKEILAFPVYGTAVWLMYVLSQLVDAYAITVTLSGLVLIGFAAWLYQVTSLSDEKLRRWGTGLSTLVVTGAVGLLLLVDRSDPSQALQGASDRGGIEWQSFTQEKLESFRSKGSSVFVDFTAAWCITCKVNERIALADRAVVDAFRREGVVALRADWTRQDAEITKILETNSRAGVPLYLFYPRPAANGDKKPPVVLPQILTVATVLRELQGQQ
jgi:thiol:disulfide interchange protein/DsbC/DsbD-like thiol-disulfide interchange protein